MKKVILITGASSGIGFATLEKLVHEGHVVYGTARKSDDLEKIKNSGGLPLALEISDYENINRVVNQVLNEQKRLDVLFNNAGYGLYGAVEETSIEDAKKQFEVNLFSLAYLTQRVIPVMRQQQSGMIINTSSMGGKVYTPFGAWYHASKHALEGWSDCLRLELAEFGIKVVIIEPGGIQTPWGAQAADNLERISSNGPYKGFASRVAKNTRQEYENPGRLSEPSVIADVVAQAIRSHRPKTRYVAGKYARLALLTRKYFGDRIYDRVIMYSMR